MTDELRQLCMKTEGLRVRLISVQNGRYVHEACSIANILCNAVPNLEYGYEVINDLENGRKDSRKKHNWTLNEARSYVKHVEKLLHVGVDRAIKFLNSVESKQ